MYAIIFQARILFCFVFLWFFFSRNLERPLGVKPPGFSISPGHNIDRWYIQGFPVLSRAFSSSLQLPWEKKRRGASLAGWSWMDQVCIRNTAILVSTALPRIYASDIFETDFRFWHVRESCFPGWSFRKRGLQGRTTWSLFLHPLEGKSVVSRHHCDHRPPNSSREGVGA